MYFLSLQEYQQKVEKKILRITSYVTAKRKKQAFLDIKTAAKQTTIFL